MIRVLLVSCLALVLIPAPAASAKVACTVEPSVISLSGTPNYTVSSEGGAAGEYYEIIISQKHDGVTDEGRDALVQADSTGFVTNTFTTSPWVDGLKDGLLVGPASVKINRYRTGGGPGGGASLLSTCMFQVTA